MQSYQILSMAEFDALKVKFTSALDPFTKKPINLEFSSKNFETSDMPLFKMAAHEKLRKLEGQKNIDCSVKY